MKSLKLLLLFIISFVVQNIYCDMIPDNTHYVNKCVKITNIDDYNNLALLGYVKYVGTTHENTYEISTTEFLTKGYKFNTLDIFAVNSDYIKGKDIESIDLPNDSHALKSNIDIEPYAGYFPDSIPVDEINEFYKVLGFTETSVVLFMWKEIIKFNDGSADSVKTYDYTGDISALLQKAPTGHKQLNISSESIFIYPNPANKFLDVDISSSFIGGVGIKLFSSNGSLLFSSSVNKKAEKFSTKISFDNYTPGVYFVSFKLGDVIETKRIIIQQN